MGLAAALLLALLLASEECPTIATMRASTGRLSDGTPNAIHKIRHVVIIMQENRSSTPYFGTYPGADGIPGLAGNAGELPCLPDPQRDYCVHPYHDASLSERRRTARYGDAVEDINDGKMNGFIVQAEQGQAEACRHTWTPRSARDTRSGPT